MRARAPVAIFQGDADDVILPAQTRELVSVLESGGVPVELIEVSGGTHVDTAFGFLGRVEAGTAVSVAWVKAALDLGARSQALNRHSRFNTACREPATAEQWRRESFILQRCRPSCRR